MDNDEMNLMLLQKQYSDMVQLKNRSNKEVEFMFDGKVYKFKPYEKKNVPRFVAEAGINRLPIKMDMSTNQVTESFLAYEGFDGPDGKIDFSPESIESKPKYDLPSTLNVDGHTAKMKQVNLVPQKESFANQGAE